MAPSIFRKLSKHASLAVFWWKPKIIPAGKANAAPRSTNKVDRRIFIRCPLSPNVAHQPPRAHGVRHVTERSSRGWLHVLVNPFHPADLPGKLILLISEIKVDVPNQKIRYLQFVAPSKLE